MLKNIRRYVRLATAACVGCLAGTAIQSQAAVRTWTGGGNPDVNWSNPANWDGGVSSPVAGDHLIFDGTTGLNNNNDLASGLSFSSITFATNAGAFVLTGNTVKIGANGLGSGTANGTGGVTNFSPSLQTFYIQVQNDRTTRYAVFGGDIINYNKLWDWRWYMHGPGKLIVAATNTASGLNGNVLGIDGGTMVFAAQPNAGVIGHGLFIHPGGTVQIVGPSTNQIASGRDIYMSGGTIQIQTTNAAGLPAGEDVSSLKSSSAAATGSVVENGSSIGPVYLGIGEGNNRRGNFVGTIRNGNTGELNLKVLGASWQTLAGTNSYSGLTLVTNGTASGTSRLMVDGVHTGGNDYIVTGNPLNPLHQATLAGRGIIAATRVDLLDYSFLAPGGTLSAAAMTQDNNTATFAESTAVLTFSNAVNLAASTATLDIHLGGTTPGAGYDQIVIAGNGSFSNNSASLQLTLDLGFSPVGGEKFTIVEVQGTSPAHNIGEFATLNGIPTDLSQGATFSVGAAQFRISYRAEGSTFDAGAGNGNDIMLEALASTSATLTWRGDVSGDWDVQSTASWRDPANAASTFTNLDNVTFNDSGIATNVNLTTDLNPAKVLVDSTKNYFYSGIGKLTGGILLTKTNTGTLFFLTENDYSGSTTIAQGTLQIGVNGTEGAIRSSIVVSSNGVLAFNRADDQVFHPAAFSGTGTFIHNGSGTLIITNDYSGTFSGVTTNSGGKLQFGDGTTAGNGGRLGGRISIPAGRTVEYNFAGTAQTVAGSLNGAGDAIFGYASGSSTIQFGGSVTNTGFTGTTTVKPYTRLQVASAAATPAGPIVVQDDGSGGYGAYFNSFGGYTNLNAITLAGQGPGTGVDTPRGKGALRLNNTWAGPITLSGNATIGASGGTGTIIGNISDSGANFTLEYLGGTILVGPSSGLNSYGTTVIMEDPNGNLANPNLTTVRALNSNPFSSGPVQMIGRTRFEVNGNVISVGSLVDLPLSAGSNFPPSVVNGSTVTPATLNLGADNSSQTFGGIFANGGTQPLNVTKLGTGTYTLTGDSTNTGAVTVSAGTLALAESSAFYAIGLPVVGSGSFSNASLIAVNSGATLDVQGRLDQRLTLNANQTLKGSGTVNGSLTATTGSVVNPGDGVGTLTITGNAVLSGTLLMDLNRTNTPSNSDRLVATGGITYGGTLAVTNVGPALQAGDFFQLFPSGVAGFSGFALQTDDLVNNVKYTWNNTIASSGRITVASVTAAVNTTPTNIVSTVSGGELTLSWPADHIGWTLQVQTNSLSVGLSNNWVNVPGSATTNEIKVPVYPANGAVFYRLVYP